MTTRRGRFERRGTERRIIKAREERFIKSLEEARETLDEVIEKAEQGDNEAYDSLEQFSGQMDRVYSHAQRLEGEGR